MKATVTSEQKWVIGALAVVALGAAPAFFMKAGRMAGSVSSGMAGPVSESGDAVPIVQTSWAPRAMTGDERRTLKESLKVDLNHADIAQLNGLPNVGDATAQAIIDYRDIHGCFRDVDELQNVKGIGGGAKFEAVKDHIRVDLTGCSFRSGLDAERPSRKASKSSGKTSGGLVNINTADEKELDALPGIGKTTAKKIIDYRTENGSFSSIDDLMDVPGVREGMFEKVKDLITVN